MTQEQKQIKLAEVQGILSHDKHGSLFHTKTGYVRDCPDYFNDLNAVHELESRIMNGQFGTISGYIKNLSLECIGEESADGIINISLLVSASATERCEAIGQTLNLW
jgi:hypothetical protein